MWGKFTGFSIVNLGALVIMFGAGGIFLFGEGGIWLLESTCGCSCDGVSAGTGGGTGEVRGCGGGATCGCKFVATGD